MKPTTSILCAALALLYGCSNGGAPPAGAEAPVTGTLLTGEAAMGDWTTDAPGVRRRITPADMPAPFATDSASNGPRIVPRPAGAMPKVPAGFTVSEFASDLTNPRQIATAPNGDLFVAESRANRIRILRDADGDGKPEVSQVFATGLRQPFGIAFHPLGASPRWVYVANTDSVVRFPYTPGAVEAQGPPETVVSGISAGGQLQGGGHWTRDIAFSKDGSRLFVSIGSRSNVSDDPGENDRARIFSYTADGKDMKVYAHGIRNPVGITVHPVTGDLWTSVNERDGLGDNLVPDYVTRVREGGFYGWPWFYIGANQDPRHPNKRPDLKNSVVVPDVLIQSHSASLDMVFYDGNQFPAQYKNEAFSALHGSWNRARRTGYKVIRIPTPGGRATGEYEDFMTGFVTEDGNVWGRPVGLAVAKDGSLFVSDDGGNVIWKVRYGAGSSAAAVTRAQ